MSTADYNNWQQMQQELLKILSSRSSHFPGPALPFHLFNWSEMMGFPELASGSWPAPMFQSMNQQNSYFEEFSRQFAPMFSDSRNSDNESWQNDFSSCMSNFLKHFNSSFDQSRVDGTGEVFTSWEDWLKTGPEISPLYNAEYVTRMQNDISRLNKDFIENYADETTKANFQKHQEGVDCWYEYCAAAGDYFASFRTISEAATELVKEKITAMPDNKEGLENIRDFYAIWIECHDESYETHVQSEEYSRVFGRYVNSVLAIKLYINSLDAAHEDKPQA